MSIIEKLKNFNSKTRNEEKLWDKIYNLWKNAESKKDSVDKLYNYWDGKYDAPKDNFFQDQARTSCNIIKQIVETKITAMLDTPFTISVVPENQVFADFNILKEQAAYADILHQEIQNILNKNRIDDLKEKVARWGDICGFGALQTTFETKDNVQGEIKLNVVNPKNLRWDKNATKPDDCTFIAYQLEMNPVLAKNQYGKNPDGSFNEEICNKIDELSDAKSSNKQGNKKPGIVSLESSETSNLAYVYESSGIKSDKIIKLVVMFLLDDSLYAPNEADTSMDQEFKQQMQMQYPNGRMIIFSPNEEKKIIFEDRPSPESFKNLGNIDFFKPIDFDNIVGKGDVEDLIPIQDRINGTYLKMRTLISQHISSIVAYRGNDFNIGDDSFVNRPVVFLEGLQSQFPQLVSNESINYAKQLIEFIEQYKQEARDTARINETMLNGVRQTGTTSADQVEALQESPMASIRAMQRNFKDFMISVGEKIINFIQEYYTVQRLVKLSTGIDGADYAHFNQDENNQKFVELYNEAGEIIKTIKVDPNWKFKVEVTAGTEIPRSRRENAILIDRLYNSGALGDPKDIDVKEQYFRAIDLQNYRAIINLEKKKQDDLLKNPPQTKFTDILNNPDLAKSFSEIMKALEYNTLAKSQILELVGLNPAQDNLQTAPAQMVTSKADIKDYTTIVKGAVSFDPTTDNEGRLIALELDDKNTKKGGQTFNEV